MTPRQYYPREPNPNPAHERVLNYWHAGLHASTIKARTGIELTNVRMIVHRARKALDRRAVMRKPLCNLGLPVDVFAKLERAAEERGTDMCGIVTAILFHATESDHFLSVVLNEDGE